MNRLYFRSLFSRHLCRNLEHAFPTETVTYVVVSFPRQINPHAHRLRLDWQARNPPLWERVDVTQDAHIFSC